MAVRRSGSPLAEAEGGCAPAATSGPPRAAASRFAVDCHACRSSAIIDSPVSISVVILSAPAFSTSVSTSHQERTFLTERTARVYRSILRSVSENSDQLTTAPASEVTPITQLARSRYESTAEEAVQSSTVVRSTKRRRV